jgi:hypothetical protein
MANVFCPDCHETIELKRLPKKKEKKSVADELGPSSARIVAPLQVSFLPETGKKQSCDKNGERIA